MHMHANILKAYVTRFQEDSCVRTILGRGRDWSFTQSFTFVTASYCETRDLGQMFLRRIVAASHAR
jgi:hypothetical protein